MTTGKVLETGTHASLVAQGGAYKTLVDAQAFVETHSKDETFSEKEQDQLEYDEKRPGDALHKSATLKSIPDSVYNRIAEEPEDKRHSLFYLFKRMGRINSDQKLKYALGLAGAVVSGLMYALLDVFD